MQRNTRGVEKLFPALWEDHAPPLQLDLVPGEPLPIAAVWEARVGDRQFAVLVQEECPPQDCAACGGTVTEE